MHRGEIAGAVEPSIDNNRGYCLDRADGKGATGYVRYRAQEKRGQEDRFRTFYRANTRNALHRLAGSSGLTVERIDLVRSVAAPLAAVELLLRALASDRVQWLRPKLIAVLSKPRS